MKHNPYALWLCKRIGNWMVYGNRVFPFITFKHLPVSKKP